jgi:DNA-binding NarL/FixJ family response regulator
VTDRWHLLKNLSEAVTKMMTREYARLSKSLLPKITENSMEVPEVLPIKEKEVAITGILRIRFDEMKKLQAEGLPINRIAAQLGMSRQTVRKYMSMETLLRKSYKDRGMIENYFGHIKKRMKEDTGLYLKTLWS